MSIQYHILTASGNFDLWKNKIETSIKIAEKILMDVVPINNIDVVVYNNPTGTIKEIRIGGYTPFANVVFISLDLEHPNFEEMFEKEFLYTLVHEINHAIRFRTPILKETLFEAMISEGLDDHFAVELTKRKVSPPWCTALDEEQEKNGLKKPQKFGMLMFIITAIGFMEQIQKYLGGQATHWDIL